MTIEEKNETLRDLGKCIKEAKMYFDNGNDFFTVQSGAWRIEFDYVPLLEVTDKNAQDKQDSCLSVTDWAKKQQENER